MDKERVRALADKIRALPEPERETLAEAILPALPMTAAGLRAHDPVTDTPSDAPCDALIDRERRRRPPVPDAAVAAVLIEALDPVRHGKGPR